MEKTYIYNRWSDKEAGRILDKEYFFKFTLGKEQKKYFRNGVPWGLIPFISENYKSANVKLLNGILGNSNILLKNNRYERVENLRKNDVI